MCAGDHHRIGVHDHVRPAHLAELDVRSERAQLPRPLDRADRVAISGDDEHARAQRASRVSIRIPQHVRHLPKQIRDPAADEIVGDGDHEHGGRLAERIAQQVRGRDARRSARRAPASAPSARCGPRRRDDRGPGSRRPALPRSGRRARGSRAPTGAGTRRAPRRGRRSSRRAAGRAPRRSPAGRRGRRGRECASSDASGWK